MNHLKALRSISFFEGMSYIILLLIAMPLKYGLGYDMAVSIVGGAHGFLFVLYCVACLVALIKDRWGVKRTFIAFLSAVVPFYFIAHDRQIRKEEEAL